MAERQQKSNFESMPAGIQKSLNLNSQAILQGLPLAGLEPAHSNERRILSPLFIGLNPRKSPVYED